MTDEILSAESVAQLLRCSEAQAEELMRNGKLPATKVGRGWITLRSRVLQFVEQQINLPRAQATMDALNARLEQRASQRRQPPTLPDLR